MNSTGGSTTPNDFLYSATNIYSLYSRVPIGGHLGVLFPIVQEGCLSVGTLTSGALCVLSIMAEVSQLIFLNYSRNPKLYDEICVAIGWFDMFCLWMKLLFTLWATFHLFCFAVFHWNLKRLEVLHVSTSLLIPRRLHQYLWPRNPIRI